MSLIHEFIFNRLSTTTAVSAIVNKRIYHIKMPDNPTLPAITYQILSGDHVESFNGSSKLRSPVISIDTWAVTAKASAELAEAVRVSLHGYSGAYSDLIIQNVLEWSENEMYDIDTQIFHVSSTCRVWYFRNA